MPVPGWYKASENDEMNALVGDVEKDLEAVTELANIHIHDHE